MTLSREEEAWTQVGAKTVHPQAQQKFKDYGDGCRCCVNFRFSSHLTSFLH